MEQPKSSIGPFWGSQPRPEIPVLLNMSSDFLKKKKNKIFYCKISTTIHEQNYRAESVPHRTKYFQNRGFHHMKSGYTKVFSGMVRC
jgi:hypothetical protein